MDGEIRIRLNEKRSDIEKCTKMKKKFNDEKNEGFVNEVLGESFLLNDVGVRANMICRAKKIDVGCRATASRRKFPWCRFSIINIVVSFMGF